jgi:uracil DNA glycosylase
MSRGWFENLKKQIHMYNMKKTGESASADSVAGPENAEHFKMIKSTNYHNKALILMGQA